MPRPSLSDEDIVYLCETIGRLSQIPIRAYSGRRLIGSYEPASLPIHPVSVYEHDLLSEERAVSAFFPPDGIGFYGTLRSAETTVIMGPALETAVSEVRVRKLAAHLCVKPEEVGAFVDAINAIGYLPLFTVLQLLAMLYFILTGIKLGLPGIVLHSESNEAEEVPDGEGTRNNADVKLPAALSAASVEQPRQRHSSALVEEALLGFIRQGKPDELAAYLEKLPSFGTGQLSPNRVRNEKNTFIVSVTLASRAAIEGGMDQEEALSLSDSYINRCEVAEDIGTIRRLYYHMVIAYAQGVQEVRIGDNPSELVLGVTNYVRTHLYEHIETKAVAEALYVSRGFLSTQFKRETGQGLAAYIQSKKIDEAKNLLRHTTQPITAIAAQLGFSSQSHFNAVFKRVTGLTPRAWRGRG